MAEQQPDISTRAFAWVSPLVRFWRICWDALGRPSRAYPMLALGCGVLLVCLIPPFGGPDEPVHFMRAYQLTALKLRPPTNQAGYPVARVPRCLQPCFTAIGHVAFHGSIKMDPNERRECWNAVPDGKKSQYECAACFYSPLVYVPQALAVALGRLLQLRPILLLYLARAAGLLTGVFLVSLAIRVAPAFHRSLLLLGLVPMVLEQFAIVTADTLLIGMAFLLCAVVLRILHEPRSPIEPKWWLITVLASVVLGSLKPPYVVFLLLLAAAPGDFSRRRRAWSVLAVGGAAALTAFVLWERFGFSTSAYYLATRPTTDDGRITGQFLRYMGQVLGDNGFFLLDSFIGRAGWLDVHQPQSFTLLVWAVLAVGVATDAPPEGNPPALRIAAGLAFALATVALIYATYRLWTPNPNNVPGRYFMPLAPCVAIAAASPALRPASAPSGLDRWFALFSASSIGVMAHYIAVRFYG